MVGEGGRGEGPVDLGVNASIIDRVVPKVGAFIAHGGRSPVDWGGLAGGGNGVGWRVGEGGLDVCVRR